MSEDTVGFYSHLRDEAVEWSRFPFITGKRAAESLLGCADYIIRLHEKLDAAEQRIKELELNAACAEGEQTAAGEQIVVLDQRIKELEEELTAIKHEAWRLVQVLNAYDGSGIPGSDASDAFVFLQKIGVERVLRGEER